jgi:hypothetical protein
MKAKSTTKRGVSVMYSHEFADGRQLVRVVYQDDKGKRDGYYVSRELDSLDVQWSHAADVTRTYTVTCTTSGQATACQCEGFKFGHKCRHILATAALLSAGHLDNGPTQGDYPEGWGWDEERAEAESDYYRLVGMGGSVGVSQYRAG